MSDNVIILGAGASFAAGIPLLGNFMDRISDLARLGQGNGVALTESDQHILNRAIDIRNGLRNYHAQVSFNQFNIEDILSILSFDAMAGSEDGQKKLDDFTRAIARTIELSCNVKHSGRLNAIEETGPDCFRQFWRALLDAWDNGLHDMPAIISFNYDLVLERSLLQTLVGHRYAQHNQLHADSITVTYGHSVCPQASFHVKYGDWDVRNPRQGIGFSQKSGLYLEKAANGKALGTTLNIPLIKLHGSLNLPKSKMPNDWSLVASQQDPYILPPVFNKGHSENGKSIWKAGLDALRSCKRVIVCGYSLPTTDVYMQYFLKAALGPNEELDRIYVFDPVLNSEGKASAALQDRYSQCFSPQFKPRIDFSPRVGIRSSIQPGTFEHLVSALNDSPGVCLFGANPRPMGTEKPKRPSRRQ